MKLMKMILLQKKVKMKINAIINKPYIKIGIIKLIKFLNDKRKEGHNNENDYSEQKKLYEV